MNVAYRRHQKVVLGVAMVGFFASAPGQSFLISVFVDDMLVGTGLDRTTFSALYAAGTVVSAVTMLLLGRLIDRHGLRPAWMVITLALAAACGLASVATGAVVAFLALATLRTFGQGSFPLLGTLLVARSFERRRGQAMAVAHLGVTGASILLPPAVGALILQLGWRHTYQLIALGLLVVVLPLAAGVRTGPPRTAQRPNAGTDHGSHPPAAWRWRRLDIPNRGAAVMLVILAAPPLVGTALTFHAISILGEQGLTFLQAGLALSMVGFSSAVGTIGSGLVIDRLGNRTLLTGLSGLTLAAPATLLFGGATAGYLAFGLLGLGLGGMGVINGSLWARTYGLAQIGRLQGTAQSTMITAAAAAPLIPALSLSATGGYDLALLVLIGFSTLTVGLSLRWRP